MRIPRLHRRSGVDRLPLARSGGPADRSAGVPCSVRPSIERIGRRSRDGRPRHRPRRGLLSGEERRARNGMSEWIARRALARRALARAARPRCLAAAGAGPPWAQAVGRLGRPFVTFARQAGPSQAVLVMCPGGEASVTDRGCARSRPSVDDPRSTRSDLTSALVRHICRFRGRGARGPTD